jgi:hypothetical protein
MGDGSRQAIGERAMLYQHQPISGVLALGASLAQRDIVVTFARSVITGILLAGTPAGTALGNDRHGAGS